MIYDTIVSFHLSLLLEALQQEVSESLRDAVGQWGVIILYDLVQGSHLRPKHTNTHTRKYERERYISTGRSA